jgi:hypothetical protein
MTAHIVQRLVWPDAVAPEDPVATLGLGRSSAVTADTPAPAPHRFTVEPAGCAPARSVGRGNGGSGLWTTNVVRVGIGAAHHHRSYDVPKHKE